MTFPRILASAALSLSTIMATPLAHALDFKTVGAAPAILYDAPSIKGGKLFIAPRGMPVEVVLTYGEWVKVRDVSGELAWTEAKLLSSRRNVVVRAAGAKVRSAADDGASAVLNVDKGVLLELVDAQAGSWIKVRHKDGVGGYIKASEIWGL